MNRNLVLVRAGDQSLHPQWLTTGPRSFDLAVSYFGDAKDGGCAGADLYTRFKGGKWNGIARFFEERPTLLSDYDYIWLPDDDLRTTTEDIERIFQLARLHQLDVCQPTLSHESYYSYLETLTIPGFELRYSNMVEIMAPCLSAALLRQFLPMMAGSMSGFGFDMVWGRIHPSSARRCAMLDQVQVTHTRPVGSALRPVMTQAKQDPWREQDAVLKEFGCGPITPVIHAARLSDQREITGPRRLGFIMAWRYWRRRRSFLQKLRPKYLRRLLVRQCINPQASLNPVSFKLNAAAAE